ncbi:MAG TPA: transferrin receptor-like dimerization domain-containing protein, partial [Cyclobacteriaceae bacterium]|nr:transferrin receptor-like dimerization domain-containing protein [Cyclobacteriaceae bacterium]
YATDLKMHFETAEKMVSAYDQEFSGFKKSQDAIQKLQESSTRFASTLASSLQNKMLSSEQAQRVNQQMIQLEKSFLDEKGMYFGQWYQSLYASTDPFSGYASWILPGIRYEAEQQSSDKLQEWDQRYAAAISDLSLKIERLIEEL